MKQFGMLGAIVALLLVVAAPSDAQVKWVVGGRIGLSIFTGGGGSQASDYLEQFGIKTETKSSTQAGLQIGPTAEVIFSKQFSIVTEFNINTQSGTPIEWANLFKTYFLISGSQIRPYADGGFNLIFITGGPYFGIRAGGGALFPIGRNLYIPADLQFGPVFTPGSVTFYIVGTTGIRYFI